MAEMEMRIETRESTMEKIADKLGLNQPTGFDLVDRSKFSDESAYFDAVVRAELELRSPEYRAALQRVKAQYREKLEREQREKQETAYKGIRATIQLDSVEMREVDTQAAEMAKRDLAAGRISASGLGSAIAKYAGQLAERRKDIKASNQLFNSMLRGTR